MSDITIQQMIKADAPETKVITLNGKMTIQYAEEIKKVLQEALANNDRLQLDLEGVSEVDLTGLQLICAAHISAIRLEKQFIVNFSVNEPIKTIVQDAGFIRHIGCSIDISKTCVWAGGDNQWEK
jgi:anti-anti-sigma factor